MITTQGLPEFSFMLGARWDVATLRERTNFNYGFLEFLSKKHPLGSNHKGDYCDLDISLTPKEPDPTLELPQPRLFSAKVTTTLSGRTKPVRVTYYLDQDLIGWQVYDISIGKKSLTQRYSDSFYSQLSQGGYAKLNAYLTH